MQSVTTWSATLDGNVSVFTRLGDIFAPHAQATPNMTVALDPGHIFNGTGLTEVATQTTTTITAPVSNPRIDRVVVAQFNGVVSVVTGTEAVSPTPPTIPAGTNPVAQVLLQTSSTAITNSMVTDERDLSYLGGGITGVTAGVGLSGGGTSGNVTLSLATPTPTTIGGVESYAAVAHQWINTISTAGVPSSTQPAFTDISGQATLAQLPSIGNNKVLGNNSGVSAAPASLTASNVLDMIDTTQGDVLYRSAAGWAALTPGSSGQFLQTQGASANPQWANANTGTVTSVGLSMPADFTVSGSPVTGSGTLTVAYANESANTVLAGPASGAAATPTWRALVFADLPAGVAPLNSPAFTGTPTVPTPTTGDNSNQIADTAFVQSALNNLGFLKYLTASTTVGVGQYLADTTGGAFTITLPASPNPGDAVRLVDGPGFWATNHLTVNPNGNTIMGNAGNLVCDTLGNEDFILWFKSGNWSLQ